jgi:alcohol dehydrogenase class IV
MLSGTYEFLPQDRVIFGRPASEAVVETADRMAKRRLLIVASKTLSRKTDVVSKIQAALAERCVASWLAAARPSAPTTCFITSPTSR